MDVLSAVQADRVVAVVRAPGVADPAALAAALSEAGITAVEFTFTIPDALGAIEKAAAAGALVGAGTVTEPEQARAAIAAGARFVVSPVLVPEVVPPCREAGVPVFLAGFTPTEVAAAVAAGADAVKLFPASLGGPRYVRDLRGPFPDIRLIPSGGVDEGNARDFLDAGAVAVFAGSGLVRPEEAAEGKHEAIARRAASFVRAVA
jgi:2-dehydro-3-deoxyphosphogluconate aldolase / (4S)-4-hydroxy-2-oxoglutarate aldolase